MYLPIHLRELVGLKRLALRQLLLELRNLSHLLLELPAGKVDVMDVGFGRHLKASHNSPRR